MGRLEKMTIDEANKWLKYTSYELSDLVARRGTEGVNPLIPRQEYELAAGIQTFFSHPPLMEFVADKIGMDGIRGLGRPAHREFGSKINSLCNLVCQSRIPIVVGRASLVNAELITPADYSDNIRTLYTFVHTFMDGFRKNGRKHGLDYGYVSQILDQDVVEGLRGEAEPLDDESRRLVHKFNAAIQMQGFTDHFDCRLGLGDTGPYELEDRLMLVRDCYVNEKVFHWSDACEGLPFSYSLVITLDKKKMMEDRRSGKLKFFSVYDTGTVFSDPFTYERDVLLEAAAYFRK